MWFRLARGVAAGIVAGIAALASYFHMHDVAQRAGEHPLIAHLIPGSVDGLMIVATLTVAADRRAGRSSRWSTWAAFLAGLGASLAANVLAARPDPIARCVAAWPALALLLVVEMLAAGRPADPVTVAAVADEPVAVAVAAPADEPVADDELHTPRAARDHLAAYQALVREVPDISQTAAAARIGISARWLGQIINKSGSLHSV